MGSYGFCVILQGGGLGGQGKDLEERFNGILYQIGSKRAFSKGKRGVCDIEERGENMEANCIIIRAMQNG